MPLKQRNQTKPNHSSEVIVSVRGLSIDQIDLIANNLYLIEILDAIELGKLFV